MSQDQTVSGGIVVHSRTELYTFNVGPDALTYFSVDGTYTGDLDGRADEAVVAVVHADGTRSSYGFGAFTGKVKGRSGTLTWKFTGNVIEILEGTGELSGLKGSVPYAIKPGSTTDFTYSGVVSG